MCCCWFCLLLAWKFINWMIERANMFIYSVIFYRGNIAYLSILKIQLIFWLIPPARIFFCYSYFRFNFTHEFLKIIVFFCQLSLSLVFPIGVFILQIKDCKVKDFTWFNRIFNLNHATYKARIENKKFMPKTNHKTSLIY